MTVQEEIETILSSAEPTVEVLRVDPIGKETIRIYIDSPEGVSLDLCTPRHPRSRAGTRALRGRGQSPAASVR